MTQLERVQATVDRVRTEVMAIQNQSSEADLNAALGFASAQLDTIFRFRGEKADPSQPRAWPRAGVLDKDGQPVTGVPERVQDATYFLAGCRLIGKPFGSDDPSEQRDVITYLLILLDGLTDPQAPMQVPARPAS